MDTIAIAGVVLFAAMTLLTIILRERLNEGGGMNTYGLIMCGAVIAALCTACFFAMPEYEFTLGVMDLNYVIATSPAERIPASDLAGYILFVLGIGQVLGLAAGHIRYVNYNRKNNPEVA